MTDKFKEWFGEYDCFEGVPACKFANLDSNVGNILINESGKWIIDYEWCFDYPIPVEFVKYINLSWLYYFDVPELQEKHTFSDFLAMFNICDYLDIYQQMERMHGKNIDIENNTNVKTTPEGIRDKTVRDGQRSIDRRKDAWKRPLLYRAYKGVYKSCTL